MCSIHRRLLAAFLVTVVVALLTPPASGQLPLGVMTFNIRTSNIDDGPNSWSNRKGLVADLVNQFGPDVLGMQEVVREQVEYFEATLPDYRWVGIDRGLNGGQGLSEYSPIFYRHAELSPIESGNFWLSATPDVASTSGPRPLTRIVTWARFHHRGTRREFFVFNTHLSPGTGRGQSSAVGIIKERLQRMPAGSAVIVLGDFNAPAEDSAAWRDLTADALKDAWLLASERRGPPTTMSGFGPPREGDPARIDWILVGGPIAVRSAETVVFSRDGRYPSDHYPVAARVEIQ